MRFRRVPPVATVPTGHTEPSGTSYDQLVQEWTRKAGRPPTWLLGYRQPAELV